jgi:hypothetical protein
MCRFVIISMGLKGNVKLYMISTRYNIYYS